MSAVMTPEGGIVFRCLDDACKREFRNTPQPPVISASPEPVRMVAPQERQHYLAPADTERPYRKAVDKRQLDSAGSVIAMAKRQLRELDKEIKRLKKLEPQRDALRRLLAAADTNASGQSATRQVTNIKQISR